MICELINEMKSGNIISNIDLFSPLNLKYAHVSKSPFFGFVVMSLSHDNITQLTSLGRDQSLVDQSQYSLPFLACLKRLEREKFRLRFELKHSITAIAVNVKKNLVNVVEFCGVPSLNTRILLVTICKEY